MLDVQQLTKRYDAPPGIQRVSFTVRPGEVFGLPGPNGSGKIVVFSAQVLEVVEQVGSRVVILKDGRMAGQDSVAGLRHTLQLSSLDALCAALTAEQDADDRRRELIRATKTSRV